jgi:hypothetical protein
LPVRRARGQILDDAELRSAVLMQCISSSEDGFPNGVSPSIFHASDDAVFRDHT